MARAVGDGLFRFSMSLIGTLRRRSSQARIMPEGPPPTISTSLDMAWTVFNAVNYWLLQRCWSKLHALLCMLLGHKKSVSGAQYILTADWEPLRLARIGRFSVAVSF